MSAFLRRLRSRSVELSLREGRLRVSAPKGVLTPALRAEIAARKPELLAALGAEEGSDAANDVPHPRRVSISWAQRRFWFLHQLAPDSSFYNLFLAVRLRGALDLVALQRSLSALVRRHESLRTTLELNSDGEVEALVHPPADVALPLVAGASESAALEILERERRKPMEPTTLPMLRAAVLRVAHDEHILALSTHHFACDGWSLRILPPELAALYLGLVSGQAAPPLPRAQYADF